MGDDQEPNKGVNQKLADPPKDVATVEDREASRARAPDSPVPGERKDV